MATTPLRPKKTKRPDPAEPKPPATRKQQLADKGISTVDWLDERTSLTGPARRRLQRGRDRGSGDLELRHGYWFGPLRIVGREG